MSTVNALSRPDLPDATQLAVERTHLAHERTMMAWVRTATSLISFGFTVYKFFQFDNKSDGALHPSGFISPRRFALLMIGTGLISLFLATLQNERSLKLLTPATNQKLPVSLATWVAGLLSIVGILAFISVLCRQ